MDNNETQNYFENEASSSDPLKGKVRSKLSESEGKLKEYGKKSLVPVIDLLHRYKDEMGPYFMAIVKGLNGAVSSFEQSTGPDGTDADRVVAQWFRDASDWFTGAQEKMASNEPKDLLEYLDGEARKNPGLMFTSSYLAGLAFGRLGRHLGKTSKNEFRGNGGPSDSSVKH